MRITLVDLVQRQEILYNPIGDEQSCHDNRIIQVPCFIKFTLEKISNNLISKNLELWNKVDK